MDYQFEVSEIMRSLLDRGERMLWTGRAKQGIILGWGEAFSALFGIIWFAVLLNVLRQIPDQTALLILAPALAVTLFSSFGRLFYEAYARKKTLYAITDHRVLIRSGVLSTSVRSMALSSIFDMKVEERRDGGGKITFGMAANQMRTQEWWEALATQDNQPKPAFLLESDVTHVAEVIRRAQAAAVAAPSAS
jgi:hypothetical protein